MLIQYDNGAAFASGAQSYEYRPATSSETYERIIARVRVGGIRTAAMLDTGGIFFICTPELGAALGLGSKQGAPTDKLLLRGRIVSGSLFPLEIELIADEGDTLPLTVAAFVPKLELHQEWFEEFPCVLGLHACLERIRFAVNPARGKFYFGAAQ